MNFLSNIGQIEMFGYAQEMHIQYTCKKVETHVSFDTSLKKIFGVAVR